ncbi:MAG: hypothetical protein N3D18_15110 [Roseococcus sp.]|nr:hypothetical protein [Roseococcus sp.]
MLETLTIRDSGWASVSANGLRGLGGQGGAANAGSLLLTNAPGGPSSASTVDHADSAPGGAGGAGGNAAALLQDNRIATGAGNDSLTVLLRAVAGAGGEGGRGGAGIADQTYLLGSDARVILGAAAGPDGARGADGTAVIRFENNSFHLGEGNDTLALTVQAVGSETRIVFRGNTLDGGDGFDTLDLGGFGSQAFGWGAVVDVARGRLSLGGGSPQNSLAGFERFHGSMGDDRFLDGAGAHFYAGGAGQDRFVFTRNHGHDVIEDLEAGDVIEFSRFGARLDSFEDVLARSTDDRNGLVVDTGFGGTLTLLGWQKAALTAEMFGFT